MKHRKWAAPMLALVLILSAAAGGTLAWLVSSPGEVVNTFTYGDIRITLTETTGSDYTILPGVDLTKDPKVTVKAGSEACWLFVRVREEGTFVADKVTYAIAEGWNRGDGTAIPADVFYRSVDPAPEDMDFYVLRDNRIHVSEGLTREDIRAVTAQPKLTFTAFAVQRDAIATAQLAWAAAAS